MINSNDTERNSSADLKQGNCDGEHKLVWTVKYKPNNDSQPWSELHSYDNQAGALLHAARVSGDYFLVKVIHPDGSVVWGN